MRLIDFFKDKGVFFSVNIITFIILVCMMIVLRISLVIVFTIGFIWFLPLLSYMALDYIKYKRYFSDIEETLESLDKKYLLPEIMEESNFIIGEKLNGILKILSRDMHENVKYYKNMQEEYREYIETWVHEIKTPIASTKLLIENNNNEVTKKIDSQIDKIENYVEQVLYYSRSDEVGKDYIIKEVNLDYIIRNVLKRNYRDFIYKNIKLELEHIDINIYSDVKWVEFILNQIIGNSIKYLNSDKNIIKIECKEYDNSVILKIEDNGIGISEKDIKMVFEKGFTGENGRLFGKSTGIGLYLCKKLCKKLGLGLDIESIKGKGTKVYIIFPNYKLMKVQNLK